MIEKAVAPPMTQIQPIPLAYPPHAMSAVPNMERPLYSGEVQKNPAIEVHKTVEETKTSSLEERELNKQSEDGSSNESGNTMK